MGAQDHWQAIYSEKPDNKVSWHEEHATLSVNLIKRIGVTKDAAIIDIGAGTSHLVDDLLRDGYSNITLLDISQAALDKTKARLASQEQRVNYIHANLLDTPAIGRHYDLWHDRAAFHFLIEPAHQQRYVERMVESIKNGGYVILATFANDGPTRCSGLPVMRYSATTLTQVLGARFQLVMALRHTHNTPAGTNQAFIYCVFKRTE